MTEDENGDGYACTEDHEMSIGEIVKVLEMFRGFVTSGQHVHPTVYMQQLNKFNDAIAALKMKEDQDDDS